MSLNIPASRILDPRLSQSPKNKHFEVNAGGAQVTSRREPSNSSNNNSTIT